MVEKLHYPGMYVECRSCNAAHYTLRSDGRCNYCGSEYVSLKGLPEGMCVDEENRRVIQIPGLERFNEPSIEILDEPPAEFTKEQYEEIKARIRSNQQGEITRDSESGRKSSS